MIKDGLDTALVKNISPKTRRNWFLSPLFNPSLTRSLTGMVAELVCGHG